MQILTCQIKEDQLTPTELRYKYKLKQIQTSNTTISQTQIRYMKFVSFGRQKDHYAGKAQFATFAVQVTLETR